MSSETIRQTIAEKLATEFAAAHPTVKMFFENQPFAQPNGVPWVYVSIVDNFTDKAQLGASRARYKTMGVVSVDVHVPNDTGTKTLREIAASISSILLYRQLPLIGETGSVSMFCAHSAEPKNRVGWYVKSVDFEFRAYSETP